MTFADAEFIRLDFYEQPLRLKFLDDTFSCFEPVQPREASGGGGHLGVFADHLNAGQVVALAGLEIVGIVRGRDLDGARAELGVGHVVEDNRDLAIHQRQPDGFCVQGRRALVFGIERHRGVAQHGLGARGCDHDRLVASDHGITDVPQAALGLFVLDFEIGQRGLAARAPVDDVIALVDESLFVQPHEGFAHRARQAGIEREALARPVAADAGALHLLDDAAAVLLFPLPDAGFEGLAAEVALGQAFLGELALDHDLGGDAGVIGARQPQRVLAEHAVPAHLRVDDGVLEHVAHVERPGDVGRRNDEREVGLAGLRAAARKSCDSTHHWAQCGSNRWGS